MKVDYIYYWNDAKDEAGRSLTFFGYKQGHPLVIAWEGSIEVDAPTTPQNILDRLFAIFNGERPKGYRGPSMSVGSVVRLEGVGFWSCESFGWKYHTVVEGRIGLAPAEWGPAR